MYANHKNVLESLIMIQSSSYYLSHLPYGSFTNTGPVSLHGSPTPALFSAATLNSYSCFGVRSVTLSLVSFTGTLFTLVQVSLPGSLFSMVYPVILPPPSSFGGVQLRTTDDS